MCRLPGLCSAQRLCWTTRLLGSAVPAFNRNRSSMQHEFTYSSASSATSKVRQEIKDTDLSDLEAAKVFSVTRATAAKWFTPDDVQDRSHRAHKKLGL